MCRRQIIIKNHRPKLAPHGTLMVHVDCNWQWECERVLIQISLWGNWEVLMQVCLKTYMQEQD